MLKYYVIELHYNKRSNWWYLLPIFFGLIGGIISYFILRHDDPNKARNCLYLGIALAIFGLLINFIINEQIAYRDIYIHKIVK